MRDRRLLCSVDAFIAADDALADTGPARADQYRQDPPRGGADAPAPDWDDGLAPAAAGVRDLRSGDRSAGRGGGRAGDRRRDEIPAAPALLDLHRRGDAPGSAGRLRGHRRGATGRAPRARACVHRPAAVGARAGRDLVSGRRYGQAAGARVDPRRRGRVTPPPVDPAQRRPHRAARSTAPERHRRLLRAEGLRAGRAHAGPPRWCWAPCRRALATPRWRCISRARWTRWSPPTPSGWA